MNIITSAQSSHCTGTIDISTDVIVASITLLRKRKETITLTTPRRPDNIKYLLLIYVHSGAGVRMSGSKFVRTFVCGRAGAGSSLSLILPFIDIGIVYRSMEYAGSKMRDLFFSSYIFLNLLHFFIIMIIYILIICTPTIYMP